MSEPTVADCLQAATRIEAGLAVLQLRLEARDRVMADVADAAATLADEATAAREDRLRIAEDNRNAHNATGQIVAELRTDTDRLVTALNGQTVALASANASVEVLRSTNRNLWWLVVVMCGVTVFLVLALLALYAQQNGQDAGAAYDAAGRATQGLVPVGSDRATPPAEDRKSQ